MNLTKFVLLGNEAMNGNDNIDSDEDDEDFSHQVIRRIESEHSRDKEDLDTVH